jgi:predicted metal-dependent phosphoesterase TrpH
MGRIDLHTHSTRSDGSLEPAALAKAAAEAGLVAFALTDHDTLAGLAEAAAAAAAFGVEVIRGVEVTARFPGRAMHLLGYGFDPQEPTLVSMLAEVRAGRTERNARILARLAELGVPVTMEDVHGACGIASRTIGRPHIATAMVRRGHVRDEKAAFAEYLKDGGPAYVAAEVVDPEEVIAAVAAAGGATSVAHPRSLRLTGETAYGELFDRLAAAGLSGIEVFHPSHSPVEREVFHRLATERGLVPTAGSDFHGAAKPDIRLGVGDGTIDARLETWERLRARCAA